MTKKQLNVLRVYHEATKEELHEGMNWYADVHQEAERLADTYRVTLKHAAGIIAALSPRMRWGRNIDEAEQILLCDGDEHASLIVGSALGDNVRKACSIARGDSPEVVLQGNKVRAFYQCIVEPESPLTVCVDVHAYSIWLGRPEPGPTLSDRLYARVASDYVAVARSLSLVPCQLQAITWTRWRRTHTR